MEMLGSAEGELYQSALSARVQRFLVEPTGKQTVSRRLFGAALAAFVEDR